MWSCASSSAGFDGSPVWHCQFGGGEEDEFIVDRAPRSDARRSRVRVTPAKASSSGFPKGNVSLRLFPAIRSLAVVKRSRSSHGRDEGAAPAAQLAPASEGKQSWFRSFPAIRSQPVVKMSAPSPNERGHRRVPRLALGLTKFGGGDRQIAPAGGEENPLLRLVIAWSRVRVPPGLPVDL